MKGGVNLGRFELLQWINSFTNCEYPKIEHLGDCVAFCQALEELNPNSINLAELNCTIFINKNSQTYWER